MTTLDATAFPAQALPAAPAPKVARFVGDERAYWRLLIHGSVFLLVTLGIYRFWLNTDMRRFLWSHTEVAGDHAEYTGTARELLLGFLIAMAILIPVYGLLFVIALRLGPIGQAAGLIGFAVLTFLGHYAVYRARRYRLTRTVFRGVRFYQTGSAWLYGVCAVFWWILIILTLGLAYPFAQSRLERFKMRNTYFGNLPGRFEGSGTRLFLRGIFMWFLVMGPLVGSIIAVVATFNLKSIEELLRGELNETTLTQFVAANTGMLAALGVAMTALTWSLFIAVVLYPVFQAMMLRWWLSGVRIGEVVATSYLRKAQVYGAYLRFIGWSMLLGIAASIVIGIATVAFTLGGASLSSETHEIVLTVAAVVLYVIVALAGSALYQVKVKLAVWRMLVESLDLANVAALSKVSAEGAPSSAVGEGLADALNVGGI